MNQYMDNCGQGDIVEFHKKITNATLNKFLADHMIKSNPEMMKKGQKQMNVKISENIYQKLITYAQKKNHGKAPEDFTSFEVEKALMLYLYFFDK